MQGLGAQLTGSSLSLFSLYICSVVVYKASMLN